MDCALSGLAAISKVVNNNFDVKVYTEEMMSAITNPMADLAKTVEAYNYFHAMYEGQDFTTSSGEELNFADLPKDVITTLHADVIKVLKSYDQVNVPTDSSGDTTPLLTSDGKKATLLDVVSDPTAQFHVDFKTPAFTGSFWYDSGNTNGAPAWSNASDGSNLYKDAWNADDAGGCEKMGWGKHLDFGVDGLQASIHEPGCSNHIDWNLSGSASAWEASGALNPVSSDQTATNADANNLENFLQQHM